MEHEPWTLERLSEVARGYRVPLMLLALVRTGVVEALASGPSDASALASARGLHEGALTRVLDAMVACGLLVRSGHDYALPADLARDLRPGEMGSPLDSLLHTAEGMDKWMALEQVLRLGHAEYPDSKDVTRDAERNEHFIRAMHAHAGPMARRLADLIERENAMTFLDLGGGPGTFCLALLDRWPGLVCAVADLPLTLRTTRRIIEASGVGHRMSVIEADFFEDRSCDLGGPWDLVLVSAVIHSEGEEPNRDLFGRVRRFVRPGGRIVVRETLLDPGRTGPLRASMFDVHMLVSTRRGRCYTQAEISDMLVSAGFVDPALLSGADDGFIVARA